MMEWFSRIYRISLTMMKTFRKGKDIQQTHKNFWDQLYPQMAPTVKLLMQEFREDKA